jgi:MFS transporter, DHA1 family, inner membrane transport protein
VLQWGIKTFAAIPCLQTHALSKATGTPNVASPLSIGEFNVGNAMGAWIGAFDLSHGHALDTLPYVAVLVKLAALAVTVVGEEAVSNCSSQSSIVLTFP